MWAPYTVPITPAPTIKILMSSLSGHFRGPLDGEGVYSRTIRSVAPAPRRRAIGGLHVRRADLSSAGAAVHSRHPLTSHGVVCQVPPRWKQPPGEQGHQHETD